MYFDIQHGDEQLGRIVMGLYGKTVPKVRLSEYFMQIQMLTDCRPLRTSGKHLVGTMEELNLTGQRFGYWREGFRL